MYSKYSRIHFAGIGGVGMYSLALHSIINGKLVSGSDISKSALTASLEEAGAVIYQHHKGENVKGAELVVYSLSIATDNPELIYASEHGIPTLSRAEFMSKLISPYKNRIAVSGSHGKSTVTAMLAHIFLRCGKDPTVMAGAAINDGIPYIHGSDEYIIYEACEYKDSFLKFTPTSVSVTNLELDHTDYFKSLEDIKRSFLFSLNSAESFSVINTDDGNLLSLLSGIDGNVITVGASSCADLSYSITSLGGTIGYSLRRGGKDIGTYSLMLHGVFNISNAMIAIATAYGYGIEPDEAATALESFSGIPRRMELVGYRNGRPIIYDYAHHPTEIKAVIDALHERYERLTVIFRPHTYSRTRDLWDDFVRALRSAEHLILTDIFAAREPLIYGVSAKRLADQAGGLYLADKDIVRAVDSFTSGAIAVMGAGELEDIKNALLNKPDKFF